MNQSGKNGYKRNSVLYEMMTKVPLFLGTYKPAFCELLGLISRRSHLNIMRLSQEIQIGVLNPFFLSSILDRGDREILDREIEMLLV